MYSITDEMKTLYKTDSIPKSYYMVVYDNSEALLPSSTLYPADTLYPLAGGSPAFEVKNTGIVAESVVIKRAISDQEDIVFGACIGASIEFEALGVTQELVGKELDVRQKINGNNELPIGRFTVESVEKKDGRITKKVIAYDRMALFDKDVSSWYQSLWKNATSMTLKEFRTALFDHFDVIANEITLVNDNMTVTNNISPSQISGREIVQAICEINGAFGQFDRNGNFQFIVLAKSNSESVDTITTSLTRSFKFEEYLCPAITGLNIRQEENDIGASVGNPDNAYVIQGNFLVYGKGASELSGIASNTFDAIKQISYTPIELTCKGLSYLDVGDLISIQTTDGTTYKTYVLESTLSGVQALTDEIVSAGSQKREENFGLNQSITQLEGKTNVLVRTVEELTSTISELNVGYSEVSQKVDSIKLSVVSNNSQTTISLKSGETEINNVSFDSVSQATVESLISANVNGIKLGVSNSYTGTSALITLSDKDGIVLSAGEIVMSGAVTYTSLANSAETTVINGGSLTTCNLYASNLYANSNDLGTLSQMSYNGYYVYVSGYQKAFLGINSGYTDSTGGGAPALILGTDTPAYIEKFWNGGHCMWVGNGYMTCGILFNFTTNTYRLYGTAG